MLKLEQTLSRRQTLLAAATAAAAAPLLATSALADHHIEAGGGDKTASQVLLWGTASKKMSEMAKEQASGEAITEFAKLEVEEQETVAKLLREAGVQEAEMKPDMQAMMQQLESARGKQFDQTYLRLQTQGHEKLLELNQEAAEKSGMKPPVIVAKMAVPAIKSHLAMLEMIQKQMM